ncbi:MAG: hypothetical protein JWQ66_525 [Mucilaginibacter sp.]|nr:hypothetical protein [Mucilaginibacter sp.]
MLSGTTFFDLKKLKNLADWKLLLFLVLFLNVKLAVKIPAIALIYLLQFDFKFGFSFKNSRLPLFYLLAIAISVLNWVISMHYFNLNYNLVLLTGVCFWVLCILAMHQVKLFVENNDIETIHRTIIVFFILNAVLSFCNLAAIIIETGSINPYTYQGQYQKYFIGTGDYIRGITFDTSTTNAVLNALGVIYFLTKKNAVMLLVCMAVMLFTGSNFTNILLLICFAILFIFKSSRDQKSLIAVCMGFLVVFMVKISPQNYLYVRETVKNTLRIKTAQPPPLKKPKLYLPITLMPDSLLTSDQIREKIAKRYMDSIYVVNHPVRHSEAVVSATSISHNKITATATTLPPPILKAEGGRPVVPTPDINTTPYQHINDTGDYQKHLLSFIGTHKTSLPLSARDNYKTPLPGKVISWLQTLHFFVSHPFRIITGDGIGNFSSKLAFRASGLGFAGGYPQKYIYLDPDFLSNHLDVYLNFFSKKTDFHSLSNNPDSVYDQLFAEYGLLGLIAFMVWYLGYFLKHYKKLTYGLPILLMVLALFFIEYWFEQLSILVFFELLLLLNIKESSSKTILAHAH